MKISGEIETTATQGQIWDILGDLTRLPEWIDKESLYVPPAKVTLLTEESELGSQWEMVGEDDSIFKWEVDCFDPGIALGFFLYETNSYPLPIDQINHEIYLEMIEGGSFIEWHITVNLAPLTPTLERGEPTKMNRLRSWYYLREISEQFEQMIDESLDKLINLVEGGKNDTNEPDNKEGWHDAESVDSEIDEFDKATMGQAGEPL